jgi:hypothetical protein
MSQEYQDARWTLLTNSPKELWIGKKTAIAAAIYIIKRSYRVYLGKRENEWYCIV